MAARDRFQAQTLLHAPRSFVAERVPPVYGALEEIDDHTCLLHTGADWLAGIALR